MGKVGLIIVFNHKFDKNINKLRTLYSERFHYIKFLVPFYQENDPDVITVYENSFQFQGYFAQGFEHYFNEDISHYIFIGDDLILNPLINENNICTYLKLRDGDSFFESFTPLNKTYYWSYQRFADAELAFKQIGSSYKSEIPTKEKAEKIAMKYGLEGFSLKNSHFSSATKVKQFKDSIKTILKPLSMDYPLVTGYSDFAVISKDNIKEFTRLCGIFASMRLFVEIAIPTAVMLSCQSVRMQKDISMKTEKMWKPSDFVSAFENKCDYKIDKMSINWPERYMYLHPIKLSKWS